MEDEDEDVPEKAKEIAEEPLTLEEEEDIEIPEEYEELGRKRKVLRMMLDKQYEILDVIRTIRMTLRQDAIPDKSLMQRLQEEVDLLKKYRDIY